MFLGTCPIILLKAFIKQEETQILIQKIEKVIERGSRVVRAIRVLKNTIYIRYVAFQRHVLRVCLLFTFGANASLLVKFIVPGHLLILPDGLVKFTDDDHLPNVYHQEGDADSSQCGRPRL